MNLDSNYPAMGTIDYERAPWNKEEKLETITATKTYSFSFSIPVTIPEGLDDNYELQKYFDKQCANLDEIFKYLKDYFSHPRCAIESDIRLIAENAIVDDSYTDFY